jgi:hypothetical protein
VFTKNSPDRTYTYFRVLSESNNTKGFILAGEASDIRKDEKLDVFAEYSGKERLFSVQVHERRPLRAFIKIIGANTTWKKAWAKNLELWAKRTHSACAGVTHFSQGVALTGQSADFVKTVESNMPNHRDELEYFEVTHRKEDEKLILSINIKQSQQHSGIAFAACSKELEFELLAHLSKLFWHLQRKEIKSRKEKYEIKFYKLNPFHSSDRIDLRVSDLPTAHDSLDILSLPAPREDSTNIQIAFTFENKSGEPLYVWALLFDLADLSVGMLEISFCVWIIPILKILRYCIQAAFRQTHDESGPVRTSSSNNLSRTYFN